MKDLKCLGVAACAIASLAFLHKSMINEQKNDTGASVMGAVMSVGFAWLTLWQAVGQ